VQTSVSRQLSGFASCSETSQASDSGLPLSRGLSLQRALKGSSSVSRTSSSAFGSRGDSEPAGCSSRKHSTAGRVPKHGGGAPRTLAQASASGDCSDAPVLDDPALAVGKDASELVSAVPHDQICRDAPAQQQSGFQVQAEGPSSQGPATGCDPASSSGGSIVQAESSHVRICGSRTHEGSTDATASELHATSLPSCNLDSSLGALEAAPQPGHHAGAHCQVDADAHALHNKPPILPSFARSNAVSAQRRTAPAKETPVPVQNVRLLTGSSYVAPALSLPLASSLSSFKPAKPAPQLLRSQSARPAHLDMRSTHASVCPNRARVQQAIDQALVDIEGTSSPQSQAAGAAVGNAALPAESLLSILHCPEVHIHQMLPATHHAQASACGNISQPLATLLAIFACSMSCTGDAKAIVQKVAGLTLYFLARAANIVQGAGAAMEKCGQLRGRPSHAPRPLASGSSTRLQLPPRQRCQSVAAISSVAVATIAILWPHTVATCAAPPPGVKREEYGLFPCGQSLDSVTSRLGSAAAMAHRSACDVAMLSTGSSRSAGQLPVRQRRSTMLRRRMCAAQIARCSLHHGCQAKR
jgi:hypothetical protein